jgi:hypothetical protein
MATLASGIQKQTNVVYVIQKSNQQCLVYDLTNIIVDHADEYAVNHAPKTIYISNTKNKTRIRIKIKRKNIAFVMNVICN